MKQVAVLQSNYIPWKGYFDIINSVDEFIWYDDVQYTKRDWRNRNRIKTSRGSQWLTIPCRGKGRPLINQVEIDDPSWRQKHWQTLSRAYCRAPYFNDFHDYFEELYLGRRWQLLHEVNRTFVERICQDILGVTTRFVDSARYSLESSKQERMLDLLEQAGADRYLSGPAAKDYLDEGEFLDRGIELVWMDYGGYPVYPQLHGRFEHKVSILDLLFNVGDRAPWYIWGWREGKSEPISG